MDVELFARNIGAHWVQAGVLVASALMALRLLKLNEPRARLAALHVTLAAIVLLPLLQPWRSVEPALEVTPSAIVSSATLIGSHETASGSIGAMSYPDFSLVLVGVLIGGAGMRLLWLVYGIFRLGRFSRMALSVPTPAAASEIESDLGVSARYIQQTSGRGPWTFGWMRPAVALPAGFDSLAPSFQRAVICHELLHIKRRDTVIAFFEELAVAALWFHPWMWLLRARIRVAREQAVDARVVARLGNRDEYVYCLVDMSGHDLAPHFSRAGAGMLRPRELKARVDAIFEEVHMSRARFAVGAMTFLTVTIAMGLAVSAAVPLRTAYVDGQGVVSRFVIADGTAQAVSWSSAARSQAAQEGTRRQTNKVYPEYPQDALDRGIQGTVVVDITINAAGDVTTAAVASGPRELHASAFKAALGLKYTPGSSTTAMKIAFHYTLSGSSWGVRITDVAPNISPRPPMTQGAPAPSAGPDSTGAYRIGGAITPPKKIKDARPVYPPAAQDARVQGVVILEARIDENGNVSDVRTLRSIPLLDQAAIDSVKQWQYTPTLMNGVAVPVLMTVTVNFSLRSEVRLKINMPNGTLTLLRVTPNGGIGRTEEPSMSRFGFAPLLDRDSSVEAVKVTIYEFDETDSAPRRLGDVDLMPGAGPVQSATTPSFGIELMEVLR